MSINILAIESSCDDTSAAVLQDNILLSNVIASQKVHESYGGVVPELASRAHQQNIVPVVSEAIKRSGLKKEDLHDLAVAAFNDVCTGGNPRPTSVEDIEKIYNIAF